MQIIPVLVAATLILPTASDGTVSWLTGEALQKQLRQRVPTIHWQDAPFRQAVETLAHANRIALLIDRRVDPSTPLTLTAEDIPLVEVFRRAAETGGLAMGWIGPVLFFGPAADGPRLETALELRREEVRKLSASARRRLMQVEPIRWSDFAEPRILVSQLAKESGVAVHGLEHLPHDLWAAADLPPLAWIDRVGLIAGQFDATPAVQADGAAVSLVPIPADVALVRSYPGGRDPEGTIERWREILPASQFKVAGGKIFVRGLLPDHRRIAEIMNRSDADASPSAVARPDMSQTRFTIREAKGSVRHLLESLAGKLQLELKFDDPALEAAGVSLDRQISLSVKEANLEELFEAILKPAGCAFRLEGNTLYVQPAPR